MAQLTLQTNRPLTFKNVTELNKITPIFRTYQTNVSNLDAEIYFGDPSLTITNVATGTTARITDTTPTPSVVDARYSVFPEFRVRPLLTRSGNQVLRLTSAAASDGFTISGFRTTIKQDGFLRLLLDGTSTANTTIVLTNTTSGTLTFTAIAGMIAQNNIEIILPLSSGTASSFTYDSNGEAIIQSITITMSNTGQPKFKVIQFANNIDCFTGAELAFNLNCLESFTPTLEKTLDDILCYTYADDTTATEQTSEFEIVVNDVDRRLLALAEGRALQSSNFNKINVVLNAPAGANSNIAINNGTLTLATGLDAPTLAVSINGVMLTQVRSSSQVATGGAVFHYATTTGVFTFPNNDSYNGKIPTIIVMQNQTGTSYVMQNREFSPFGSFTITRKNPEGVFEEWLFDKVRLASATPAQEDKVYQHTLVFKAYFYNNGINKEIGRRTFS